MAKKINITAQLNAATTEGILADAGQIFDAKKGKFQAQLNEEFEDALEEAITSEETDKVVESIEEGIVHNALRKTKQILTEAEKGQARENIGAVSEQTFENEAVRVKKQVFTSEQKYQARHNISAITAEEAEKIAQDKINETSVSSPDKLQAVKELSSWLESNPDNAATMNAAIQENSADIQRLYRGTGIDEYSEFSTGMDYAAGDVVLYDGVLFRFKTDHAKGEWDYNEVEEWSEKKERVSQIRNLNTNTGMSEYPAFDDALAYNAGEVVLYEGKLKRFLTNHAAGVWVGTDCEDYTALMHLRDKIGVDIALKKTFTAAEMDKLYLNSATHIVHETGTTDYKSFTLQCYRGLTYKWDNEPQHVARFSTAPRLGVNNSFIELLPLSAKEYTPEENCYLMFTINTDRIERLGVTGGIVDSIDDCMQTVNAHKKSLEGMNQALATYKDVDLSMAEKGFYVPTKAVKSFTSSADFDSVVLSVEEGVRCEYAAATGGMSMANIIYYDGNGNILAYENRGTGEYPTQVTKHYTIAPKKAAEMSFTTYNRTPGAYLKKQEGYVNVTALEEDVEGFKSDFLEKKSPNLWKGETVDGVITTSGTLQKVESWAINKSTTPIPVKGGNYYYLSGRNGNIQSIRCLDANGNALKVLAAATGTEGNGLSFYLPDADGLVAVLNGQFKVPDSAVSVQISLAGSSGTWDKVMLEHVGDRYIEDYEASEYMPYSDEKIIAKEKIPYIPNENADTALSRKYPLKILLIGSSHGMNTISQLPWIAYKNGFDVTIGNVYRGSLTLQQIATSIEDSTAIGGWFKIFKKGKWLSQSSTLFIDVISAEKWDYIILQRSASDDEMWTEEQSEAMDVVLEKIKEKSSGCPTILFNTGFADPSDDKATQIEKSNMIMSSAKLMREEFQLEIIPVVTAIQNARNTKLSNIGAYAKHQLCYDSQHLDYGIGCYIAGATVFEFIFKKYGFSILNMKGYASYEEAKTFVDTLIDTGGEGAAYTEPTKESLKIAKYCAMAAVKDVDTFSAKLSDKYK